MIGIPIRRFALAVGFFLTVAGPVAALPTILGDLDEDGEPTVQDMARLAGHMTGTQLLPATLQPFADLTKDGTINSDDQQALLQLIVQSRNPEALPLTTVRFTSPADGEGNVAVTRETVIHFTLPLALNATLDTSKFRAEFGGRKFLSRVDLSSDRKKATLFYLEPLPSSARVQVTLDGTGLTDILGRPVSIGPPALPGGPLVMSFDTISITPVAATAIKGRVLASKPAVAPNGQPLDTPLAGVTITVDGSEETLRTVTDAAGNFTLSPCPAGSFFIHVDGRTSPASTWPAGDYYPTVGKRWEATAGRTDNLAGNSEDTARGTIYLPCVCAGTLKPVSLIQDTKITFPASVLAEYPALAGTEITVPANSLFADDGTRGGKVGIAPVAPTRLPSPLPSGLNLPLVITVQSDGATNFDRPVPVCLPNVPDPVTGQKLAPGAKSALWSFNHDLGSWEIAGPMTVTDDGLFVKTDVGIGVRQPGWHGTQPGSQLDGSIIDALTESAQRGADLMNCRDARHSRAFNSEFTPEVEESLRGDGGRLQRLSDGTWPVSVDDYSVTARLPEGLTPEDFMQEMATDMNGTVRNERFNFVNTFSKNSTPSVGDVYNIDFLSSFPFDARVIVKEIGANHFVFSTITTPLAGPIHSPHPVNGSREFGFTRNPDGTVTFYTRGADRMTPLLPGSQIAGSPAFWAQALGSGGTQFLGWTGWQTGVAAELARRGAAGVVRQRPFVSVLPWVPDCSARAPRGHIKSGNLLLDTFPEGQFRYLIYYWPGGIPNGEPVMIRGLSSNTGRLVVTLPSDSVFTGYALYNTGEVATFSGMSENGNRVTRFSGGQVSHEAGDFDSDALGIVAELVLGTNSSNSDSDGDGIKDGAEVRQGTNPLDGLVVSTGVIASAPATGHTVDVCAVNNTAITANGGSGISVFNVLSGLNPVRLMEINTPGTAVSVACYGSFIAVADFTAGLAVVDISDARNARIVRTVDLGSPALCVTTNGPIACVGTSSGVVAGVDLLTGSLLWKINLGSGSVQDVAVAGDVLYAYREGRVDAIPLNSVAPVVSGFTAISGAGTRGGQRRLRLSVGEGLLYAAHTSGWNVLDIATDPSRPSRVSEVTNGQFGFKQLVPTGSGLAVVAASPNLSSDGPHDIDLYNIGANGRASAFLTTHATPGLAEAVSVYNGLAYVADGTRGLQVVNYLAYDTAKLPPTITMSSNFNLIAGTAEEGALMRLTAAVTDDVQVRNVEFYVDGALALTDGNFPFEHRFVTPAITPQKTTFTVRARATDTGGNATWTPEITLTLVPDATAPAVLSFFPENNALTGALSNLSATFSEAMDPATLSAGLTLTMAGADGIMGNADDQAVAGATTFSPETRTAYFSATPPLPPGLYRLRAAAPASDAAGNAMTTAAQSVFRVFSYRDTDADGVPDDWETLLGLNPTRADTNSNGVPDGHEDFDNDAMRNAGEFLVGTDPRQKDSNGNGINDGLEDTDLDGLSDGQEIIRGTDPKSVDTDGDGWDDAGEIAEGSSPLSPNSQPPWKPVSTTASYLNAIPGVGAPDTELVLISHPASYLNSVPGVGAPDTEIIVISHLASYLNSTQDPGSAGTELLIVSPIATYRNQP